MLFVAETKAGAFAHGALFGLFVGLSLGFGLSALADGLTPSVPSQCCAIACLDPFSSKAIVGVCGCHATK